MPRQWLLELEDAVKSAAHAAIVGDVAVRAQRTLFHSYPFAGECQFDAVARVRAVIFIGRHLFFPDVEVRFTFDGFSKAADLAFTAAIGLDRDHKIDVLTTFYSTVSDRHRP